jgi:hypothetical protein
MFQVAIRRGLVEHVPLFPKRLEENPPRDGFFEHNEYVKVRTQLPRSYQDVLDFAYCSGCRLASAEPESVRDVTQREPAGSDGLKLAMKMSAK